MYDINFAQSRTARHAIVCAAVVTAVSFALSGLQPASAQGQDFQSTSLVRKISGLSEKLELTTNTSRILTLDKNIPRVQVNNPELLAVTPLSATQIQISAKKAGVTQVNLWDEDGNIHTVDVMIYGDARELEVALQTQFPHSSIKVYRYSESLVLKGFVDRPDYVSQIMRLAEDYAPKVINNINVGGVQQVLLKVKIMEVSRTKLRRLGVDWALTSGSNGFAVQSVSGLIANQGGNIRDLVTTGGETFAFGIVDGADQFSGVLEALQQRNVAKILAEPNIIAISGRPAQFNSGGEIPILIPQSLGTTTIEFKKFGTQVDFLPIVLGDGRIRLEVRPRISSLDDSIGIELTDIRVPGLRTREVDTAVEMRAGQTFALAGLIEERAEAINSGLPYLSDVPVLGWPFRKTQEEMNEIELLILVTPEFVDPMDPHEVPCDGPGLATTQPDNHDLYCGGHIEVPAHRNPIRGPHACSGNGGCNYGLGHANGGCNCHSGGHHGLTTEGLTMPGGVGYDDSYGGVGPDPVTISDEPQNGNLPSPARSTKPDDLTLPADNGSLDDGAAFAPAGPNFAGDIGPRYTPARPYNPPRQPTFLRERTNQNNRSSDAEHAAPTSNTGAGLIGPVGYDAE